MNAQFTEIYAWKCNKCGRVLWTVKGIERHSDKCEYVPPILIGQVSVDDIATFLIGNDEQTQNKCVGRS